MDNDRRALIRPSTLILIGSGGFVIAVAALSAIASFAFPAILLSVLQVALLVFGFLALVLTVGAVALALSAHGLSEHEHAFALPRGSIRACIALGLLVIFVGTSVFLYSGVGESSGTVIYQDLAAKPTELPEGHFAVGVGGGKDEERRHFDKTPGVLVEPGERLILGDLGRRAVMGAQLRFVGYFAHDFSLGSLPGTLLALSP